MDDVLTMFSVFSYTRRFVFLYPLEQAQAALVLLFQHLIAACSVMRCTSFPEVQQHLLTFAAPADWTAAVTEKGSYAGPCVFPRSIATVNLFRGDLVLGTHLAEEFLISALVERGVPQSLLQCPIGAQMVDRALKPVFENLKVLCLNRAHLRERLQTLMLDWAAVQEVCLHTFYIL